MSVSARSRPQELVLLALLLGASPGSAQDLDPRAYARIPVNGTVLVAGLSLSDGGVVTDATAPIQGLEATVVSPVLGVARSFALFGGTAQAFVSLPYSWADVSGEAQGVPLEATRKGFGDARMRLTLLPVGAPAMTPRELAAAPPRTVLGTSLTVSVPVGQYSTDLLVNLGTHRWAFKPEVALSQPVGRRWLFDLYAGVWLFTDNGAYFPGTSVRSQAPLGTLQGHVSYNFSRQTWVAIDATFYAGGRSTVNGVENDDRQSNSRLGATLVLPVGKRNSVKLAASTGAIVRSGANFSTVSIGWQTVWLPASKPAS